MNDSVDWSLLARYLADECSTDEKYWVETWISSDVEHQRLIDLLKTAWDTPEAPVPSSDVSKLWQDVVMKAGIGPGNDCRERKHLKTLPVSSTPRPARRQFHSVRIIRYAAGLLMVVSLSILLLRLTNKSGTDDVYSSLPADIMPPLQTVTVDYGKRATFSLSDGSHVTLDAGSKLEYPDPFDGNTRDVFLHGEAYFEIVSDVERPFVVHAREAVIQVLGTKFNVRTWGQRIRVAVAEGKVSLGSEEGSDHEAVVLTGGQAGHLADNGQLSEPQHVDVEKDLGWLNNKVVFEDVPLIEVLEQIERWYDIQFILADSGLQDERLSLHIQDDAIDEILKLVSILTGQEYEHVGRSVHLGQSGN